MQHQARKIDTCVSLGQFASCHTYVTIHTYTFATAPRDPFIRRQLVLSWSRS